MTDKRKTLLLRLALAVALALIFILFFGTYHGWIGLSVTALVTGALTVAFGGLFDRHDAKLTTRMQAGDQGEWEAWLNGIKLGTVTDSDYAAMQRAVFRDGHVAIAQLMNLGRVALVVLDKLVLGVPIMAFWLAIGLALFAPESYSDLVRQLQKADSTTIAAAAAQSLQIGLTVVIVTFGAMVAFGYRFGFRNCYSESVGRIVRRHLQHPGRG